MEKVNAARESDPRRAHGIDKGDALEQLIGKMERQAPQGTGLDREGAAPQSTCAGRIYCF